MAQISPVRELVGVCQAELAGQPDHAFNDLVVIIVNDRAVRDLKDVVKAALLMQAQCQFAVLARIAEAELHLIAVSALRGTGRYAEELIVPCDGIIEQALYLC